MVTYIFSILQVSLNGIVLTVIAILANVYPDTTIWNLWDDSFKLSELAIVDRGYFNIVFGVILCGILQLILHRFHFMKPENEEENSEKKPESEEKSKGTTEEQSKEKSEEKFKKKAKEWSEKKSKEKS